MSGATAVLHHASTTTTQKRIKMRGDNRLFWWMQAINVVSILLAILPIFLRNFIDLDSFLSTKHDYIHSIEPFLPAPLLDILTFHDSLPIQTLQLGTTTVYFVGVALECILGTVQGILLGADLLNTPKRGNYQTPSIAATALFLYAGMCISAFPIHCLKDMEVFNIKRSLLATLLQWLDTLCTSSVPALALLAGLVESGLAEPSSEKFVPLILLINAILTWFGAFLPNRWITFTMHGLVQVVYIVPLVYITDKRTNRLDCKHGLSIMKLGKYAALLGIYAVIAFVAVLSIVSEGNFCPLTSVFLVSRLAAVEYWKFSKLQAECTCKSKLE